MGLSPSRRNGRRLIQSFVADPQGWRKANRQQTQSLALSDCSRWICETNAISQVTNSQVIRDGPEDQSAENLALTRVLDLEPSQG